VSFGARHAQAVPQAMEYPTEGEQMFVIVYGKDEDSGEYRVHVADEREVSRLYDEQDFASFEDVNILGIYAPGKDGSLQLVHLGESHKINTDEEMPFRYAAAPLITADGTTVGSVTFTDH
jgi:hypothetical protein